MPNTIIEALMQSFRRADHGAEPYPHWYPQDLFPGSVARDVCELPFAPPVIGDTEGRRETHNAVRQFFDRETREKYTVCDQIASAYASPEVVGCIEERFECSLKGTYLRIEHCLDTGGFWLAPHTDLGVKRFTLLHYLSDHPQAETWGTDVYRDADHWAERVPARFNSALVFVPSDRTWHGFERRNIAGVRRSLIVNYVSSEWRNRHELASDVAVA
ncbi:MAG: 2OG-Fe(II) oxygenase [Thioalkalivibrionaceae bacterium]